MSLPKPLVQTMTRGLRAIVTSAAGIMMLPVLHKYSAEKHFHPRHFRPSVTLEHLSHSNLELFMQQSTVTLFERKNQLMIVRFRPLNAVLASEIGRTTVLIINGRSLLTQQSSIQRTIAQTQSLCRFPPTSVLDDLMLCCMGVRW